MTMPTDINPMSFVQDMPPPKFSLVCKALARGSCWEEVAASFTEQHGVRDPHDFELSSCRNLSRTGQEQARRMLEWFGNRGLRIRHLVSVLEELYIEAALLQLKDPEPLVMAVDVSKVYEVEEGADLRLECTAQGFPCPHYTWFKRDLQQKHGKEESQEVMSDIRGVFEIRNVQTSQAGIYICRVHNSTRQVIWSRNCEVIVTERPHKEYDSVHSHKPQIAIKPVFIQQPIGELQIEYSRDFEIRCLAVSSKPLQYKWTKNDVEICGATHHILRILQSNTKDSGVYQCSAFNTDAETKSWTCFVSVLPPNEKPSNDIIIISEPKDQTNCVGGRAYFEVKVKQRKNLFYEWYHDGKKIRDEDKNKLEFAVSGKGQEGRYQCRITLQDYNGSNLSERLTREALMQVTLARKEHKAEDKVALILANSDYMNARDFKSLPGVRNDLVRNTQTLQALGFKVFSYLNLTLNEARVALHLFKEFVRKGVYVVVYFAGHGLLYGSQEFLYMADATKESNSSDHLNITSVINFLQIDRAANKASDETAVKPFPKTEDKPSLSDAPAALFVFMEMCLVTPTVENDNDHHPAVLPTQIATALPTRIAVGNCVIVSACGMNEKAYEEMQENVESPRGLFNKYLMASMKQNVSIVAMLSQLKFEFNERGYDKEKYPMHPNYYTDLIEDDRSLHDPISPENPTLMEARCKNWHFQHRVDVVKPFQCGEYGFLKFTLHPTASNVLSLYVTFCRAPNIPSDFPLQLHKLRLEKVRGLPANAWSQRKCQFDFYDLQRQEGNLSVSMEGSLLIKDKLKRDEKCAFDFTFNLDLGYPLVAIMQKYWYKQSLLQCNPQVPRTVIEMDFPSESDSSSSLC